MPDEPRPGMRISNEQLVYRLGQKDVQIFALEEQIKLMSQSLAAAQGEVAALTQQLAEARGEAPVPEGEQPVPISPRSRKRRPADQPLTDETPPQ